MIHLSRHDDLVWLKSVHGIDAEYAVLYGNEDAPIAVEAYDTSDPKVDSKYTMYRPDQSGTLRKADA